MKSGVFFASSWCHATTSFIFYKVWVDGMECVLNRLKLGMINDGEIENRCQVLFCSLAVYTFQRFLCLHFASLNWFYVFCQPSLGSWNLFILWIWVGPLGIISYSLKVMKFSKLFLFSTLRCLDNRLQWKLMLFISLKGFIGRRRSLVPLFWV